MTLLLRKNAALSTKYETVNSFIPTQANLGRISTRPQKWLSMKNRSQVTSSPRRSKPRHPIAMESTAKPPDPMSYALAVFLLPSSRAHGCHMQKTWFPGQALRTCQCVRTWAVPACGVSSCGVRGWREQGQRRGCGGSVPVSAGRKLFQDCYSCDSLGHWAAAAWGEGGLRKRS